MGGFRRAGLAYRQMKEEAKKMDANKIYDLSEVALSLKVSKRTILRYISQKKLKAFKVGNGWRITGSQLDKFIASNTR